MKKISIFFAAALTLFVGCNKEYSPVNENNDSKDIVTSKMKHIEILVTTENTKATLPEKTVTFGVGDEIAVVGTTSSVSEVITLTVLNISSEGITFAADIPEDCEIGDYAYYPASIATTTDLNVNWPTSVDGAKVQVPMIALIDITNNTAVFKHLGVIAKIDLTNVPSGATTLEFNAAEKITGPYTVSFNSDIPSITAGTLTGSSISASISGDGTYYIPLPAKTYENFQFAMTDGAGYYYKQKTATDASVTLSRNQIANFGTLDYDIDEIAEWWHSSDINGWTKGWNRYIKTGDNTYQLTVYNPSGNKWWDLLDADGNKWLAEGNTYWSGPITKQDGTFNRTGADDKTFWVKLSKDGETWNYDSGNWDENSDRAWNTDNSTVKIHIADLGDYKMEKYNYIYNANYTYRCLDLQIPSNGHYALKFSLDWNNSSATLSGVGEGQSLSITDSHPYGSFEWAGINDIDLTLTQGKYDVYLDLAILNFMFVKK